jgi:hypothetical protein
MCPDRKLKWFKDNGRSPLQIKAIKKTVITRWKEAYAPENVSGQATEPVLPAKKVCKVTIIPI